MIRFRDKPKDKPANANTSAKDVIAPAAPPSTAAEVSAKAEEPLANAEPEKSEEVKK